MMPPAGSRVHAVSSALVAAFSGIPDVTCLYLTAANREVRKDYLSVALGRNGVTVRREKAPGMGLHYFEQMRVMCKIFSRSGSRDPEARMARCVDIFNQVEAIILADSRLGGTCDMALIGTDETWSAEDGTDVSVTFQILTKTYT